MVGNQRLKWLGLLLVGGWLSSCHAPVSIPVRIVFHLNVFGEALSCVDEVPTPHGILQISNLRFFLSQPQLNFGDDEVGVIQLGTEGERQEQVALVTINNDTLGCSKGPQQGGVGVVGSMFAKRQRIRNLSQLPQTAEVRFLLGVPSVLNHANPVHAKPPLTVGAMHWTWLNGYKFLRFEGKLGGSNLLFHLGSTGCSGPPREAVCDYPNQAWMTSQASLRADHEAVELHIEWNLSTLLEALVHSRSEGGDGRCQSTPHDRDCERLLPRFPDGTLLEDSFRLPSSAGS